MNRETILASIHRHLRESSAPGQACALGEIVARVARELQRDVASVGAGQGSASWANGEPVTQALHSIPAETVAAFVDGELSPSDTRQVSEAVLKSDQVLAEVIAAVRATHSPTAPLTSSLSERLLAMGTSARAVDPPRPVVPLTKCIEIATTAPDRLASAEQINERATPGRQRRSAEYVKIAVGALLTAAATILVAVFLIPQETRSPQNAELANQGKTVEPSPREDDNARQTIAADVKRDAPDRADADEHEPKENLGDADHPPETNRTVVPEPDSGIARTDSSATDITPRERPDVSPPSTIARQGSPPDERPARLVGLRWKNITGVVAQPDPQASTTVISRGDSWQSVGENTTALTTEYESEQLVVRTLPYSRAEAELNSGGRIVINGDTDLRFTRFDSQASAGLDVQHGAVAMLELPEGTVLDVRAEDQRVATLRWRSLASAVLQRVDTGFWLLVDRGTIEVNGQPQTETAVSIRLDESVHAIEQPLSLPAWVHRPVDTINVPRGVLAQLGRSADVAASLDERIRALTREQRLSNEDVLTLATLAKWRAAMVDTHLFRLAGSRVPALRLAAVQRLVEMPNWDPRCEATWRPISRVIDDQQRLNRLRRVCDLARRGEKPNAGQVDELLNGLESPQVAARALADYLLRSFSDGGPTFDPTWTGPNHTRGVQSWRQFVGRPTAASLNAR